MTERELNAKSIKKLGLGEYVNHYCTPQELRETTIKVLEDPSVPGNLKKYSKVINSKSAKVAVKELIEHVKENSWFKHKSADADSCT